MNSQDDGGPAFPWLHTEGHGGMALRDYFAAAALQGMFASDTEDWTCDFKHFPIRAKSAYEIADAMLKERRK